MPAYLSGAVFFKYDFVLYDFRNILTDTVQGRKDEVLFHISCLLDFIWFQSFGILHCSRFKKCPVTTLKYFITQKNPIK